MILEGKVALITGGNSGVGQEAVKLFHAEGAEISAVDIRTDWLEGFAREQEGVLVHQVDLRREQEVISAVKDTLDRFGKIDILFNIAGVFDKFRPLTETDNEFFSFVMETNLYGDLYTMRAVLPGMLKNGGGSIINVASIAGQTGFRGGLAYTVSKHGIVGLTKNTAFAYALQGIRCNSISPSGVNTPMMTSGQGGAASEFGMSRYVLGRGCKPRNCEPEEVAQLGLFLASDASKAINGADINIDVGASAY